MFSKTLFAVQALVASALAGNAIINNQCGYPLSVLSTLDGSKTPLPAGGQMVQGMVGGPGKSLKIYKNEADLWSRGITQFEYTITNTLWYDISFVDCANGADFSRCPGHEGGIRMEATGGQCTVAQCNPGQHCPTQAYFVWNDDWATKSCLDGQNGGDVIMTLCSGTRKVKKSVAGRVEFEA